MLILCHLLIGATLGLLLSRRFGGKWTMIACMIGSVLPDLIDKPLGHILLQNTLDFGRIYAHSLLFLSVIVVIGLALRWRNHSILLLAVAVGISSHLILDSMWDIPVTLFYPLLGPFGQYHFPNYFESSLVEELTSPLEWAFFFTIVWIFLKENDLFPGNRILDGLRDILNKVSPLILFVLAALGTAYIVLGIIGASNVVPGGGGPDQEMIAGLAALFGSSVLFFLTGINKENSQMPESSLES